MAKERFELDSKTLAQRLANKDAVALFVATRARLGAAHQFDYSGLFLRFFLPVLISWV